MEVFAKPGVGGAENGLIEIPAGKIRENETKNI
jgi:hypothetical protein